jgi:C_GCAxxG_C_C family probable redox protein
MEKTISLKKMREEAETLYRRGGFYCSEAVVSTIRAHIAPEMPEALIAAASGFPVGIGRARCICGAVSGGVIALGYFFGRTKPSSAEDAHSALTMKLAGELQESFRAAHNGVLCCHIHTKGGYMQAGKIQEQCIGFTGEMTAKTAEIITRELHIPVVE